MIAPRLIGLCHGRPMCAAQEDEFPKGCDWIEPVASFAPYFLAILGAMALASVAHSLFVMARAYLAIHRELNQ